LFAAKSSQKYKPVAGHAHAVAGAELLTALDDASSLELLTELGSLDCSLDASTLDSATELLLTAALEGGALELEFELDELLEPPQAVNAPAAHNNAIRDVVFIVDNLLLLLILRTFLVEK
jgi:hypothetical protein